MDRIRQLARRWGTSIRKRSCRDGYAFNGKTIAELDDSRESKRRTDSNLIHDIAHFVVAAPERRTLPEFGLGESPDSGKEAPRLLTMWAAQVEEELASALGIYWERELGLKWQDTYESHSWAFASDCPASEHEGRIFNINATHKFARMLQELKKRNIIQP